MCLAIIFIIFATLTGSAQKRFYNREFGFGFRYPVRSKLLRDSDTIAAAPNFKGLAFITLDRPGRGIYDATAAISAANITRDACHALSANEDTPQKKRFGTVTFEKTAFIEGGMESVHPVEFYRTFHKDTCYEIRLMVGMEKFPKRRINDAAAFEQLRTILRTFYFR
jgi:hypothetical protein